ncbi:Hypothetical predicted protein [Mytilus galloprovincialis]|nr:Hypothetical predicted protein [Mytilus galloprovincialis]
MCTNDHAVEDSVDSSYVTNSVVVRVMKQRANCTCHVSLNNNTGSYTVYVRKWSALKNSAPELPHCGLAIDVNFLNKAAEKKRNHQARGPNVQLHIQCDDPDRKTILPTTHESATTKYANKQISTSKEIALTTVTKENSKTSTVTTTEYNKEEEIALITDTYDNNETSTVTCVTTEGYNKEEHDQNKNMYIYIGSGAGGVLVFIAILSIILCIRKRSKKGTKTEKQIAHDSDDPDSNDGELKDNILYVSADQQDVVEDGNYHMVDLEKKPVVNFGVSNNQTQHISTFDNSNNEYAVVDKGKKSDSVKDDSPLDVQKSSAQDMKISGLPVDQTYAVVDKTNRGKADE